MRTLPVIKLLDLDAAGIRGEVIDFSVDSENFISILTAEQMPEFRRMKGATPSSSFQSFSRQPNHYSLHTVVGDDVTSIPLAPTKENFTTLRRMPDGRQLLVRGRQREDPPCGLLIDPKEKSLDRIDLGDAMNHIFVTPQGRIWLGFFDEAYANGGWYGGGVVLLDSDGRAIFNLNESGGIECVDCYAMTMDAAGTIYACTYIDFPILRITQSGQVTKLGAATRAGPSVMAVRGELALFAASYHEPRQLYLQDLQGGSAEPCVCDPPLTRDDVFDKSFSFDGTIYFLQDRKILAVSVPY